MIPWERAVKIVEPFTSSDETRPHLYSPALWEKHVVATDGHTLCAVRANDVPPERVGCTADGSDATPPPYLQVVPESIAPLGSFMPSTCEACEWYPASWTVFIELRPNGHKLTAKRPLAKDRCERAVVMIEDMPVAHWFPEIRVAEPRGISAHYLWKVAELYTTPPTKKQRLTRQKTIYVFGEANDPLAPFVFTTEPTPRTRADLLELPSFCLVMPCRL
jgi:hypothetical protein